jgi:hypothetical protein
MKQKRLLQLQQLFLQLRLKQQINNKKLEKNYFEIRSLSKSIKTLENFIPKFIDFFIVLFFLG